MKVAAANGTTRAEMQAVAKDVHALAGKLRELELGLRRSWGDEMDIIGVYTIYIIIFINKYVSFIKALGGGDGAAWR